MPARTYRTLAIVFTILVLVGALMPGNVKEDVLSPFPVPLHIDKVGHFVGFLLAAFCWVRAEFPRLGFVSVLAGALALGASTEYAQLFIAGRTSKVTDVLIDFCGACLGVWLARSAANRRTASPH